MQEKNLKWLLCIKSFYCFNVHVLFRFASVPSAGLDVRLRLQARSQPVFSGKLGMISRDHFACPVPSFSEMKEIG